MSDPCFRLYFNRNRQWATVYLWEQHPNTFASWAETRWGYFVAEWEKPNNGHFGALHFVKSRLRIDTVVHELDHLRAEWIWANRNAWTGRNEERFVEFGDLLLGRFIRELAKIDSRANVWKKTLGELNSK